MRLVHHLIAVPPRPFVDGIPLEVFRLFNHSNTRTTMLSTALRYAARQATTPLATTSRVLVNDRRFASSLIANHLTGLTESQQELRVRSILLLGS